MDPSLNSDSPEGVSQGRVVTAGRKPRELWELSLGGQGRLLEEATSKLRIEIRRNELGKAKNSIPRRGNSVCKGPEVRGGCYLSN